jgi:hypothetical protein
MLRRGDLLDLVLHGPQASNHELGCAVVEDDDEDFHAPSIIGNELTFGKNRAMSS